MLSLKDAVKAVQYLIDLHALARVVIMLFTFTLMKVLKRFEKFPSTNQNSPSCPQSSEVRLGDVHTPDRQSSKYIKVPGPCPDCE